MPVSIATVGDDQPDLERLVGRPTGIGFMVDDLDAEYERLKAQGVEFSMAPSDQPWGGRLATFKDPEGNQIVLDQVM